MRCCHRARPTSPAAATGRHAAIGAEFDASPTDDARDLVNAAQVMLTGERQDVRNLCKPWGVHLTAQKSIAQ